MDFEKRIDLSNWFEEIVVTRKREEIARLIETLMRRYNEDTSQIPRLNFPTIHGELKTERSRKTNLNHVKCETSSSRLNVERITEEKMECENASSLLKQDQKNDVKPKGKRKSKDNIDDDEENIYQPAQEKKILAPKPKEEETKSCSRTKRAKTEDKTTKSSVKSSVPKRTKKKEKVVSTAEDEGTPYDDLKKRWNLCK